MSDLKPFQLPGDEQLVVSVYADELYSKKLSGEVYVTLLRSRHVMETYACEENDWADIRSLPVAGFAEIIKRSAKELKLHAKKINAAGFGSRFTLLPWWPSIHPQFVYFIQKGEGGPIKIGKSSTPKVRLQNLQVGSEAPLKILCLFEGSETLEQDLHRKFSHLAMSGEWFIPGQEIYDFMERIRSENE